MRMRELGAGMKGQHRRWFRVRPTHVVLSVVALVTVLMSSLTANGTALAELSQCSDVTFIAAAGSGQHYRSDTDLSISPQLQSAHDAFRARLNGRKTDNVRVLDYPALSVDVLFADTGNRFTAIQRVLRTNVPRYLAGKDVGITRLWAAFRHARSVCPNEKIVLAGYSQGAMVVHQFLQQLNATNNVAGKAAIRGVILLADPDRVRHSEVVEFGDAPFRSYGVCDFVSPPLSCTAPDPLADIPARFRSVAISVCFVDDPACDMSDLAHEYVFNLPAGRRALIDLAKRTHESYSYRSVTRLAAARVAQLVLVR